MPVIYGAVAINIELKCMKHRFILLVGIIFLLNGVNAQNQGAFGSGQPTHMTDSVPSEISERINAFLESRNATPHYHIANFDYENYFVVTPVKRDTNGVFLIWTDYHFDAEGTCTKILTKIVSMDEVDCDLISTRLCASIFKLHLGYEREYGTTYQDYIYIYELDSRFEVFHPDPDHLGLVKFDFDGKLISD